MAERSYAERGLLTHGAARTLRTDVKCALTAVASGREGVATLLHQIERVAKYACADHEASLGKAEDALHKLVAEFAGFAIEGTRLGQMGWKRLYKLVKDARNDIAHTGTEAVLAETRTMALASVLLEALLGAGGDDGMTKLGEVMVANPVCAHEWQTVADLRRTMLVTDFSELPVAGCTTSGVWLTVTADRLATYLGSDENERRERMGRTLAEARKEACRLLKLYCAPTATADTLVRDIPKRKGDGLNLPLMVTGDGRRAGTKPSAAENGGTPLGIVTAFDLL